MTPGDIAGSTTDVAEGEAVVFTCVASNFNPVATINWSLAGADVHDEESTHFDDNDIVYHTYSTVSWLTSASQCGHILSCETDRITPAKTMLRVAGMCTYQTQNQK